MSSLVLEQGKRYRANIEFAWYDPRKVASNDTIAQKLKDAGFFDVIVTGSGGSREVTGVWAGKTQMVAMGDLPDVLTNIRAA